MSKFNPVSLEGTVVGILFSKTGVEIKEAVAHKLDELDNEATDLKGAIEDVDDFLETKEKELVELNELYEERRNEKNAQARPFARQVEEIQKSWSDKEFEINRETERMVGEKAVTFEAGFDKFKDRFEEIDELADEVSDSNSVYMMATTDSVSSPVRGMTTNSMRRIETANPCGEVALQLPTKQDKAVSRINTLRNKVQEYRHKVTMVQQRIDRLECEADELRLISRHLKDEREYTLDLKSLEALGFDC